MNSLPRAAVGDFTLSGQGAAKVVIVGGGIAGLATAYELGKAGYDCTVLEARDRTGGRNFTVRGRDSTVDLYGNEQTVRFSDGQYMNAGPARLPQWMVTLDSAVNSASPSRYSPTRTPTPTSSTSRPA